MVIFTYEDYLKYKETQNYTFCLRKKIEEGQASFNATLNDVEEKYILKLNEENKSTFRRIVKKIWSLRIGIENANKILEKIEEESVEDLDCFSLKGYTVLILLPVQF